MDALLRGTGIPLGECLPKSWEAVAQFLEFRHGHRADKRALEIHLGCVMQQVAGDGNAASKCGESAGCVVLNRDESELIACCNLLGGGR